uniref:Uncharacterized protein n=1 Tax=Musca domestica TaxID=7370 RepID=A0A1I8MCK4_MUSDO
MNSRMTNTGLADERTTLLPNVHAMHAVKRKIKLPCGRDIWKRRMPHYTKRWNSLNRRTWTCVHVSLNSRMCNADFLSSYKNTRK